MHQQPSIFARFLLYFIMYQIYLHINVIRAITADCGRVLLSVPSLLSSDSAVTRDDIKQQDQTE
jgi:hypothetical protein